VSRRSVQRLLALLALTAGVAAVGFAVFAVTKPLSVWTPDGSDLARSLGRQHMGRVAVHDCAATADGRWRCPIEEDPGSGTSAYYWLSVDRDGCWSGARYEGFASTAGPGTKPRHGCLRLLDFV
jgi:hypothetical protein